MPCVAFWWFCSFFVVVHIHEIAENLRTNVFLVIFQGSKVPPPPPKKKRTCISLL